MTLEEFIKSEGKIECCGCCYDEHDIEEVIRKAYELRQDNSPSSD